MYMHVHECLHFSITRMRWMPDFKKVVCQFPDIYGETSTDPTYCSECTKNISIILFLSILSNVI